MWHKAVGHFPFIDDFPFGPAFDTQLFDKIKRQKYSENPRVEVNNEKGFGVGVVCEKCLIYILVSYVESKMAL